MDNPDKQDFKSSIDHWADVWDKAQSAGIFKDAPKPHVPSAQTSDNSYFGATQSNPSNTIKDADAEYWNQVSQMATLSPNDMLQEMFKPKSEKEIRVDKKEIGKNVTKIAQAANPIPAWTVGPDNRPEPGETAPPYSEEEFSDLSDLKVKLHELQDKLNAADAKGVKSSNFKSKIDELKVKIEAISDVFSGSSRTVPNGGK